MLSIDKLQRKKLEHCYVYDEILLYVAQLRINTNLEI
jgi:hypothetical protein